MPGTTVDQRDLTVDADGYSEWVCVADAGGPDWNKVTLPSDWTTVLLYATDIAWNNGLVDVRSLGTLPDGRALLISATPDVNPPVTSDDKAFPMTMAGVTGELASATNDSDVRDNKGTYTLKIKKK